MIPEYDVVIVGFCESEQIVFAAARLAAEGGQRYIGWKRKSFFRFFFHNSLDKQKVFAYLCTAF